MLHFLFIFDSRPGPKTQLLFNQTLINIRNINIYPHFEQEELYIGFSASMIAAFTQFILATQNDGETWQQIAATCDILRGQLKQYFWPKEAVGRGGGGGRARIFVEIN